MHLDVDVLDHQDRILVPVEHSLPLPRDGEALPFRLPLPEQAGRGGLPPAPDESQELSAELGAVAEGSGPQRSVSVTKSSVTLGIPYHSLAQHVARGTYSRIRPR